MDVKQYFRKVRETEAALLEEYPILVSLRHQTAERLA